MHERKDVVIGAWAVLLCESCIEYAAAEAPM